MSRQRHVRWRLYSELGRWLRRKIMFPCFHQCNLLLHKGHGSSTGWPRVSSSLVHLHGCILHDAKVSHTASDIRVQNAVMTRGLRQTRKMPSGRSAVTCQELFHDLLSRLPFASPCRACRVRTLETARYGTRAESLVVLSRRAVSANRDELAARYRLATMQGSCQRDRVGRLGFYLSSVAPALTGP